MAYDTIVPVKIGQASLTTGTTVIYTVPSSTRTYVKDIDLANTSASEVSVTLTIGGGALIPGVLIPGNSIFQWTGTQILNATDTIEATASATGVVCSISGAETL